MVPAISQYYKDKPIVQRDEAMRSAGMLAMSLMLAVKSLGYDSCPMDGFDFDAVGKLINLPPDHVVCLMVAVGKKLKDAWPRGPRLDQNETVIHNHF
jgi:nitroreductase